MGMIHDLMGTASDVDLISDDRLASLDGPITADDMAKVGLLLTLLNQLAMKISKRWLRRFAQARKRFRHRIYRNWWCWKEQPVG